MSDDISETPLQRALRLKTEAVKAKQGGKGGKFQHDAAAAAKSASKFRPKSGR